MENHQNASPSSSTLSPVLSTSPPPLSPLFLPVFQDKSHIYQNPIADRMKSINHCKPIILSSDEHIHEEREKIGTSQRCDILDNRDNYSVTDDHFKIDLSSCEEEKSVEGLLQSISVSDLSIFSNDFLLEDCNSLDQASQLVDSEDFESTPVNFNIINNNSNDFVQLIKSDFKNESFAILNKNNHNQCEDNNKLVQNEKLPLLCKTKEDFHNQCETHKTVHGPIVHVSQHESLEKPFYEEPISKVKKEKKCYGLGPIKRGRRYLPNFKEKVLEYAKNHTYKETAIHFQINSNTITEWSREKRENRPVANEGKSERTKSEEPCSEYKNHKTDTLGTPESKTEFILLNDDIRLETDYNAPSLGSNRKDLNTSSPPSSSSSGTSLSSFDTKPDENFLKWIKKRRLERKELSRQEVFQMGKQCLSRWSGNPEPSSWFVLWLNRFNRVLNSVNSNVETEKYIKYPSSFKLEVVLYARLFSKNSAARVFNVSRKRTFDWYGRLVPLDKAKSFDLISVNLSARSEEDDDGEGEEGYSELGKMKFSAKKDKTKDKIYSELHLWYQKMFYNGTRPTSNEIKDKAREIFSLYGMKEIKFSDGWLQKFCRRTNIKLRHCEDDELLFWVLTQFDNNVSLSHQDITEKSSLLIGRKQFKGSKGWTLRFLKRHRNLLQHSPTFPVQLPRVAQEKSTLFWDNFRQNLVSFCVKPENIGSMDEIPLNFNYPEESNSANAPLLRKTGFENCQGVVILSSMANGKLLPPAVVFKGAQPKQMFSGQNVDIIVFYQERGFITVDILESWMKEIWLRWAPNPSALVVDSFEPHRSKDLEQMLAKKNCLLHVIPEGCSSRFQPLDIEVTPSFKEAIKNQWKEFLAGSDGFALKTSRKYRCPDQETILPWIEKAYEEINRNPVSITSSFKKTGLLQSKT